MNFLLRPVFLCLYPQDFSLRCELILRKPKKVKFLSFFIGCFTIQLEEMRTSLQTIHLLRKQCRKEKRLVGLNSLALAPTVWIC